MEYLKVNGHSGVMDYSPREIAGWFALAKKRRRREMLEGFTLARIAANGDEKAVKALLKELDKD